MLYCVALTSYEDLKSAQKNHDRNDPPVACSVPRNDPVNLKTSAEPKKTSCIEKGSVDAHEESELSDWEFINLPDCGHGLDYH